MNHHDYEIARPGLKPLALKDRNPDKAAELLPTQCGFFFGSTEYDEFYWHNIEDTVSQLEPLLENDNVDYYYRASW